MSITNPRSEDEIELAVERRFDWLDRDLADGKFDEAEYDRRSLRISQWAEEAYRALDLHAMFKEGF